MSAKCDAQIVDEYLPFAGNGVLLFNAKDQAQSPVGHFVAGYETAIKKGFAAIKTEADEKKKQIVEEGIPGDSIDKYNFYRAVSIVCEGMITLTKRYAELAEKLAEEEVDVERKRELDRMADTLNHCMENPARDLIDALQTIYMYHTCMCLDANMHAISFGRLDQYLGDFYEEDVRTGRITPEYAQEVLDLFYLKVAELNKPWGYFHTQSNPGYVSSMLMTLGGVRKDGTDATNPVTYMMLQAMGRLLLHDPPQALRIHKDTPKDLWEAALETTKISGGVPTFENDDVIIPALMNRGLSLEDARNYCLIGCVEPSGCGNEWASPGGNGTESYLNLVNAMWLAINDGYNPMNEPPAAAGDGVIQFPRRVGLPTGYLYDMKTFDEVLDAVKQQFEFFVKWQAININSFEYIARGVLPQPTVSATMDGCMEKGMDVMFGGARYNSTGMSGVGIGNIADSLSMIKHLCFDTKKCTTRELYDALISDWEGHEALLAYVKNKAPHYGNGIEECDRFAGWAAKVFGDACNACTGPRGRYSAGLYPVTTNIMFGRGTAATPDGRRKGEPLADGISPVQQMDSNGPTAILVSVANIDQSKYPNGTLLNMKFQPSVMSGADGVPKLIDLIKSYFAMGGMELQINVLSAETLRAAQKNPDDYRNLVVRIAGFSAYFVELQLAGQEDLIRRTELAI
jgi:formate C-acetyltransferase